MGVKPTPPPEESFSVNLWGLKVDCVNPGFKTIILVVIVFAFFFFILQRIPISKDTLELEKNIPERLKRSLSIKK